MGNNIPWKLMMGRILKVSRPFSYIQSKNDCPTGVKGEAYGRSRSPILQFSKWDDEAFLLFKGNGRNEKTRLLERTNNSLILTTNKRKHIYRILDGENMEYDIVLYEKPRSPVIEMPLEIPKGLSFYKQGIKYPGLMRDDVFGSYAVYWDKQNNRYKTGKFCHIYRPKIFDSTGRWIWGDLEFDGESLFIIIDETWLKKARYPVTVDPVIGTSTVGASHLNTEDPSPAEWYDYFYEITMPVNPYVTPGSVSGSCTAYYYSYHSDGEARGYPVIYSNSAGLPANRLSTNESYADLRNPSSSGEWLSAAFDINGSIPGGSNIWFGYMSRFYMFPYFDEGGTLKEMDVSGNSTPPNTFVPFAGSDQLTLSMYFEYTASENYTRDIATIAALSDGLSKIYSGKRKMVEPAFSLSDFLRGGKGISKKLIAGIGIADFSGRALGMFRKKTETEAVYEGLTFKIAFKRIVSAAIGLIDSVIRDLTKTRRIINNLGITDILARRHDRRQKISESLDLPENLTRTQNLIRKHNENISASDGIIRRLMIFLRVISSFSIWDYPFWKKARSKEELFISSPVITEIEIDSEI
jgi:hypothetical protein